MTPIHFSTLKHIARSPAHYKAALAQPKETTRAMRVGTVTHSIVWGPRAGRQVVPFDGDRRQGKAWEKFVSDNAHHDVEIVTAPEWEDGFAIARALQANDTAMSLIGSEGARYEVPLAWHHMDLPCATSGIDVLGAHDPFSSGLGWQPFIADLKTTTNSEPDRMMRHALDMHYHVQLLWYRIGVGMKPIHNLYVIAVEDTPPYAVTVLRMSEAVIDQAERTLRLWLERLRACLESDTWPAYAQSPVSWELPEWMQREEEA